MPLRLRMATKTAYSPPPAAPEDDDACPCSMANVVARHGSRHSSHIAELNALAEKLASFAGAPAWLATWRYPAPESEKSVLTGRGLTEHFELASRLVARYPGAFPSGNETYSPTRYALMATYKSRTAQSAEAFALAALKDAAPPAEFWRDRVGATAFVATPPNRLLRFYDDCDAYDVPTPAHDAYLASDDISLALEDFARAATGRSASDAGLGVDELLLAYEGCAYVFLNDEDGPGWCSLGVEGHVDALEYAKDLEAWEKKAGGNPLARRAPAALLRDMVQAFDAAVNGTMRGSWRFGHAETLLPLLTALGVFDDQPPLTSERADHRFFRTSVLAPMAANLVATLHRCTDDDRTWILKFALNERDIALPACRGQVYCPFATFKDAFKALLLSADDDWDAICHGRAPLVEPTVAGADLGLRT